MLNQHNEFCLVDYDTRVEGIVLSSLSIGNTTNTHVFSFDSTIEGIEIYSNTASIGSALTLELEYTLDAGANWYMDRKIIKNVNLLPGFPTVLKNVNFKACSGDRLVIKVNNASLLSLGLCINLYKFCNIQKIDRSSLEEGSDW